MMSATLKLATPQCGPGVVHVAGPKIRCSKVSCSSPQPKLASFTKRSWSLQNLGNRRERNALQFGVEQKASRQATNSGIRNMSVSDTQNDDRSEYHQVELMDANCLMTVGNKIFISDNDGKDLKIEYMDHTRHVASDKNAEFGSSGTSNMYFQSMSAPNCVLAITTKDQIFDKFKDHSKFNQFLYKGITEDNEHIRFTGVWLSKRENGEFKLTCGVYFKNVKTECKLDMNIRMLKLALMYDIPIYVHRDLVRHKRPIFERNVLGSRGIALSY